MTYVPLLWGDESETLILPRRFPSELANVPRSASVLPVGQGITPRRNWPAICISEGIEQVWFFFPRPSTGAGPRNVALSWQTPPLVSGRRFRNGGVPWWDGPLRRPHAPLYAATR